MLKVDIRPPVLGNPLRLKSLYPHFNLSEQKQLQGSIEAIRFIQSPLFQERLKTLFQQSSDWPSWVEHLHVTLLELRSVLEDYDRVHFYQLVSALFNISPQAALELSDYRACRLMEQESLQAIGQQLFSTQKEPEGNLPTLIFTLDQGNITIEKQAGNKRECLYKKPLKFSKDGFSIGLDGFKDFSVSIDKENGLKLELNANFNVNIVSNEPLMFNHRLKLPGMLRLKAPKIFNHQEIVAHQLTIQGTCINKGKLQAKEILLKRLPGVRHAVTLDNDRGCITTSGKLVIRHGKVSNQRGKIEAYQCEMSANSFDNRYGQIATNRKLGLKTIGDVQNQQGQICSDTQNIHIESLMGVVHCTSGGRIMAPKGKLLIEGNKLNVDESSLVHGVKATHLKVKNHARVESVLQSQEVIVSGRTLDLAGIQSTERDIEIQQSKDQWISFRQPVVTGQDLKVQSGDICNKSTLIAGRHVIFDPEKGPRGFSAHLLSRNSFILLIEFLKLKVEDNGRVLAMLEKSKTTGIIEPVKSTPLSSLIKPPHYFIQSVNNMGRIAAKAGRITIFGQSISHTGPLAKMFSALEMDVEGSELTLLSAMHSEQDINLKHWGGNNFKFGQQIQAKGMVTFHLLGSLNTIQYPSDNPLGSLCFKRNHVKTMEESKGLNFLFFMADQKAKRDVVIVRR